MIIKKIISFFSDRKVVKSLNEFKMHIRHILHVNDDILAESVKQKAAELLKEAGNIAPSNIEEARTFLEKAPLKAAKIFPKMSYPVFVEYTDILAVAFSVAFGVRALYLQPFKIPTSSMQPTLFGIHYIKHDADAIPQKLPSIINYALFSVQRAYLEIQKDGYLDTGSMFTYTKNLIFPWTKFKIGGVAYELPGEKEHILGYCFRARKPEDIIRVVSTEYKQGEILCNGWLSLGDHHFVDRYTFHFREPRRGDVVVFITENLKCRASGYFYIKRLIGLPGDTLKIIENVVYIKEKNSTTFIPLTSYGNMKINKIYSLKGGYHGHKATGRLEYNDEIPIPENCYFMMGDNTTNSYDSRNWGFVPRRNIIGRAFFVFWPFSRRWGFADTRNPIDAPTTPEQPLNEMELQ